MLRNAHIWQAGSPTDPAMLFCRSVLGEGPFSEAVLLQKQARQPKD